MFLWEQGYVQIMIDRKGTNYPQTLVNYLMYMKRAERLLWWQNYHDAGDIHGT